jgi:phosphomethylpyrimidine synthase
MIIPNIHHTNLNRCARRQFAVQVNANIGNSSTTSKYRRRGRKTQLRRKFGADTVRISTGGDIPRIRNIDEPRTHWHRAHLRSPSRVRRVEDLKLTRARDRRTGRAGLHDHPRRVLVQYIPLTTRRINVVAAERSSQNDKKLPPKPPSISKTSAKSSRNTTSAFQATDFAPPLADASDKAQLPSSNPGRADEIAGNDVQTMIESRPHPHGPDQMQVEKEVASARSAFLYPALGNRLRPGYDHITSAIGAAMIGWHGASMLAT